MFSIGNAHVDDPVAQARFCCDLDRCKGACCTLEGLRGAPLQDREVDEIRRALPFVRPYLGDESLRIIEAIGPVEGRPGEYATPCVGARECVYVAFDGPVATCSFERAYEQGLTRWRKPISCHLFPIRVRSYGGEILQYEEIEECAPGRARGERDQVRLADFLQDPLTRMYGPGWYATFAEECRRRQAAPAGNPMHD
jgi:hypothetical protein